MGLAADAAGAAGTKTERTSSGRVSGRLLAFASRRGTVRAWYAVIVGFFVVLVLLPTLYVLGYVLTGWSVIQNRVLGDPALAGAIGPAMVLSFGVALVVAAIDLLAGLPLAWILVRYDFRGKGWVNTIIDSPLAVTTAGLGFSVVLFWGIAPSGGVSVPGSLGLTGNPFLILVLLHLTTTFPYMVRSLAAILEQIEIEYENAARAAGASRLTAARTVTLPMFRSGVATGLILVLAKALSDTGGAFTALYLIGACGPAGSAVCNGTGLINLWKVGGVGNEALAFVSALMIVLSIILLVAVKYVALRFRFPLKRVWPVAERRLSSRGTARAKNAAAVAFLVFFVLVPSFFFLLFVVVSPPGSATDWARIGSALGYSFLIGGVATAIDLVMGIPMAILITRGRVRWLGRVLDALVNVPYIVPSAALGISLFLFWNAQQANIHVLALLVMAHVAFTFPFVVRNVVGALEQMDPALEETARALGSRPVQTFRRVVLPSIRPAILAGSIMALTRSVGETGATTAVAGAGFETAPVLIVNLLAPRNPGERDTYGAAVAQLVLLVVSFAALFGLRFLFERRRGRRG